MFELGLVQYPHNHTWPKYGISADRLCVESFPRAGLGGTFNAMQMLRLPNATAFLMLSLKEALSRTHTRLMAAAVAVDANFSTTIAPIQSG